MSQEREGARKSHGAFGLWTVDSGLWTPDCGLRTVDSGLWTPDCGLRTVDSGLWTPDCGLFSYWFPPVVITTSV
jgi:hypothetical protein